LPLPFQFAAMHWSKIGRRIRPSDVLGLAKK
jgi:hypothetical protein